MLKTRDKIDLIKMYKASGGTGSYLDLFKQYRKGGEVTYLQPTSEKLPLGYEIPYNTPSSEVAMSIGGENGEPAYLIPSFKYGQPLKDPIAEYLKTREVLGGPFKTWQEADEWEKNVRHPYVEKGQDIPSPIRWWGKEYINGGELSKYQNSGEPIRKESNWDLPWKKTPETEQSNLWPSSSMINSTTNHYLNNDVTNGTPRTFDEFSSYSRITNEYPQEVYRYNRPDTTYISNTPEGTFTHITQNNTPSRIPLSTLQRGNDIIPLTDQEIQNRVNTIQTEVNDRSFPTLKYAEGGEISTSIPYGEVNPWRNDTISQQVPSRGTPLNIKPADISNIAIAAPAVRDNTNVVPLGEGVVNSIRAAENKGTVFLTSEDDSYKYDSSVKEVSPEKKKMTLPENGADNKIKIMQIQDEMYKRGYYKPSIDISQSLTPNQIGTIQKTLVDKNYLDPSNVTGIMDEATTKAVEQFNHNKEVDGIVGSKTKDAFEQYKKDTIPVRNFNTTNEKDAIVDSKEYITNVGRQTGETKQFISSPFMAAKENFTDMYDCTMYANTKIRNAISGEVADDNGIYGDAWTIGDNIVSRGGKEVFNVGYDVPDKFDLATIKGNISNALNSKKPDKSIFKPGQYVELYNPGSKMFQKAFEEGGNTMTTHAGIITMGEDGNLYVEHNVHKKIYKEKLEDVINRKDGIRITRVLQPKYVSDSPEATKDYYVDATNLGVKFNKQSKGRNIADKNAYLFQKTIAVNKPIIKENFGIDDEDFRVINEVAYGVAANETYFGKAQGYLLKNNPDAEVFDVSKAAQQKTPKEMVRAGVTYSKIGRNLKDWQEANDSGDASRGWGQVKETEMFGKDYNAATGISKAKEDSPEYGALTTVSSIASKYKVLSSLISETGVNIRPQEFKSLLAISHNQGFDNIKEDLENYKNTGDYKYISQYNNMSYPKGVRRYSQEYVTFL